MPRDVVPARQRMVGTWAVLHVIANIHRPEDKRRVIGVAPRPVPALELVGLVVEAVEDTDNAVDTTRRESRDSSSRPKSVYVPAGANRPDDAEAVVVNRTGMMVVESASTMPPPRRTVAVVVVPLLAPTPRVPTWTTMTMLGDPFATAATRENGDRVERWPGG